MSSTDPTGHSPSLPGDSQHASAAAAVTSAESAGSKAETEPPELNHAHTDPKPVLSAKAAGKQQATDDLIDFGDDDLGPMNETKPVANPETESESNKPGPESNQAVSMPHSEVASEPLTSSMATLKPTSPLPAETATQYLTIETTSYVDPTPPTPRTSQPPSRTPSNATKRRPSSDASPTRSDASYDERRYASEDEQENGSRSEIQSIMEQFTGDGGGPGADEVMSPRLEIASPMLGSPSIQHPPRKSSLEPLVPTLSHQVQELQGLRIHSASPTSILSHQRIPDDQGPPVPPKDGPPATPSRSRDDRQMSIDSQMSPGMPIHRPPPPEPEPEPALPFDFHRFLEQLRNKKADPVARYLKSFLSEFGKRQWMVHEQVKIISDFLAFIANKMAQCEVWRDVSDAEFDNAREGMEKLVMNRLYTQTFSPAIPPPQPIPGAKPKRRGGERPMGPGRRGQHQEDVERDDILTQKINIYAWLREEHLDIPPAGDSGRRFLKLAQQELLKIKSYRAPRDKIICVLNCCKVIFGLLKHSKSDSSADSFMPLLIYVVLQANPEHLVSNVQYILRFRNQEKLGGEAGYYLSSLMGAIQFIENMDRTTLTITDEEFEKNVEAAVSAIAEKHRLDSPAVVQEPAFSEKAGFHQGDSSGRPSLDMMGESSTPRRSTSSNEGGRDADDQAPITGLLRSIQKPLSTIGRMFSDDPSPAPPVPSHASRPPGSSERLSPRPSAELPRDGQQPASRHHLSAEEAAARQASAEVAEAQRLSRAEHVNVVETLAGMFPDLDRDIISDVVYQKQGRVGQAVDACLALSN
ncbi:Vacuolar protein sorting-associated protein 9a [Colletotrichum higginsianum]|uniref:Vacuolar protein sorting-associated protein 9a n=1 Tax=Colletotrichum higginsianum TaxID=80884 RepID=A0A4V4NDF0_9PEZI|nr:Vacuolar protein sorting-associated protein 9a [Colletotrichum higginsianum]